MLVTKFDLFIPASVDAFAFQCVARNPLSVLFLHDGVVVPNRSDLLDHGLQFPPIMGAFAALTLVEAQNIVQLQPQRKGAALGKAVLVQRIQPQHKYVLKVSKDKRSVFVFQFLGKRIAFLKRDVDLQRREHRCFVLLFVKRVERKVPLHLSRERRKEVRLEPQRRVSPAVLMLSSALGFNGRSQLINENKRKMGFEINNQEEEMK